MRTVQEIESATGELSPKEKQELHAWFDEHLADHFDAALQRGVETGVFDGLIEDALADYDAGKTMKKMHKSEKTRSAESIARSADSGKSVSRFFTNAGKMMKPIQRVNVDFSARMLEELDREAQDLNVSRQAVIKTLLRHALDQRRLASATR